MAKRPCARPGCASLVQKGYCDGCAKTHSARAQTEAARPSAHKRGYTREWSEYSRLRLQRHPLCADPYQRHGDRPAAATLTDHEEPHKGDRTLFWDAANHQSLCDACHNYKTATFDGGFGRSRLAATGMG